MDVECFNVTANCSDEDWLLANITSVSNATFYTAAVRRTIGLQGHIQAALLWTVFAIGVPGNLLVVAVVFWKLKETPEHQAVTILLGSLAFTDLGMQLFVIWILAILSVCPEWLFGELTCKVYFLWRSLNADASAVTLMIISLDRLLGLKKIGGGYFSTKAAIVLVACCWLATIIINGPLFFWAGVVSTRRAQHDCVHQTGVAEKSRLIYVVVKSVTTFFAPVIITWISYSSIIFRTRKALKLTGPSTGSNNAGSSSSNSVSARLVVTCLAIAAVFTVCWLPLQITRFMFYTSNVSMISLIRWLGVLVAFNSCVNPIIYGLMWRPFRTALRDVCVYSFIGRILPSVDSFAARLKRLFLSVNGSVCVSFRAKFQMFFPAVFFELHDILTMFSCVVAYVSTLYISYFHPNLISNQTLSNRSPLNFHVAEINHAVHRFSCSVCLVTKPLNDTENLPEEENSEINCASYTMVQRSTPYDHHLPKWGIWVP